MSPRTAADCIWYTHTWLSYVKSPQRIRDRFAREQSELWPKLKPALTDAEKADLTALVTKGL